jgi:hypothetical protein
MKINRNMSAVVANRQLLRTENKLSISMGRLSSGYKINKAGDNPAGMAISSKMKAQIDGLDQAEANSDDGQSVLRIADGALNEVSNMLQRIRELSVQAANGTNSYSDRQSIQDEIDQLTQEVDRISTDTEYNKKTLLDGSTNTRVYVSGTQTAACSRIFCCVYSVISDAISVSISPEYAVVISSCVSARLELAYSRRFVYAPIPERTALNFAIAASIVLMALSAPPLTATFTVSRYRLSEETSGICTSIF